MMLKRINDREAWDAFIDESPAGLLFHKWDYLKITERYTGYTFLPCAVCREDEILCLLPLFYRRFHGLNAVFSPPPLTVIPHLGFVLCREYGGLRQQEKESILQYIAAEVKAEMERLSPNYLSLSLLPGIQDIREFIRDGYDAKIHYSYLISLNRPLEDIWNGLQYKLRARLKKASGMGLELVKSDDIATFYRLLTARYQDPSLDIPAISKNYLTELMHAYPGQIGIYYLYDREENVLGVAAAQEYRRFLLWIGTPKLGNSMFGNECLQWLLIRKAHSEGYAVFENMGANNRDLTAFKSKFNPELVMYFELCRMDALGSVTEWAYLTFLKKTMKRIGLV
ncbi:MAG: GNAT family N-acetyltransferase [Methanomicrobiaceae archaeon]|nr:GNAT family N-acetyltransferase [Methanomicrobiaceae archaeon]